MTAATSPLEAIPASQAPLTACDSKHYPRCRVRNSHSFRPELVNLAVAPTPPASNGRCCQRRPNEEDTAVKRSDKGVLEALASSTIALVFFELNSRNARTLRVKTRVLKASKSLGDRKATTCAASSFKLSIAARPSATQESAMSRRPPPRILPDAAIAAALPLVSAVT